MGGFHAKMVSTTNILKNHYGPPNVDAPESLWTHIKVLGRKQISLDKSIMYKPTLEIIQISAYARILDCWKVIVGHEDLAKYAKTKPSFTSVWGMALKLVETYANSRDIKRQRSKVASERDTVFENSCMFLRDALLLIEMCAAVRAGDTGRMNNVRRFWTFCWWGAGSHNYGLESFFMEQNLKYEWTKAMCLAFFDNWLYNTKGRLNCWVEPDLVQEHLNFWIKVRTIMLPCYTEDV